MKLHCPRCGTPTPAARVAIKTAQARCAECAHRFNILDGLERPPPKHLAPPPNMHVEKLGKELLVVRRWYTPAIWIGVLFCVIWNGGVLGVFATVIVGSPDDEYILWIVAGVFGAVGLLVAYGTLCQVVNRTTVCVGEDEIAVRHGPLPIFRPRQIAIAGVERLCTTGVSAWGNDASQVATFAVHALLRGGGRVTLVSQLLKPEEAWFLETQVNNYLGLQPTAAS